MSLHEKLVTFMVSTGQILARGDLRCDMQSLIAPPIRIKPCAADLRAITKTQHERTHNNE